MTPSRAVAVAFCLVASTRSRPLFATVAGLLAAEDAVGALAPHVGALGVATWAAPTTVTAALGATIGRRPWGWLAVPIAALLLWPKLLLLTIELSCAYGGWSLLRQTSIQQTERLGLLALLGANLAGGLLVAAVGVERAYASGAVAASNACAHLVIASLAAWAMTQR